MSTMRASPVRAVSARSLLIQLESPMFTSPTARDHKMAECFSPTSYGPSLPPISSVRVEGGKPPYQPYHDDTRLDYALPDLAAMRSQIRGSLIKRHASRFAHRFTSRLALADGSATRPRDAVTARRRGGEPRRTAFVLTARDVDDIAQYLENCVTGR
ncbi:hypothetical protein ALC57_07019 [Trachymyrmex cornetzi]|uniref:Uncharacterized protein n=1 Tax=Trachymyrmex cornetzi TaxID=471704 RepID=A0A151J826_9HYME|nr:hypothetical protein ALC57_07019 [Trachymyrmex cornetzi]